MAKSKGTGSKKKKSVQAKNEKPVILVTNDDGITAPGIRNLVEAVRSLGTVVVVAPDKPQSGKGDAITIGSPLRLHKVNTFEGIVAYQCTGTPVDWVKMAVNKNMHRKPDIYVSGINTGANQRIQGNYF